MKTITSSDAKNSFNGYYSLILGSISTCLRKARIMPLSALQCENPSFSQIASNLKVFYGLMEMLNNDFLDDEHKISKNELSCVKRFTDLLEKLGSAIDKEDIEDMTEIIAILAEEPYI